MCSRRHGGGRVRSTTPAEDRYIVLSVNRNRRTTAQQVANQFLAASGKQISRKTAARRLKRGGLYTRRPVVCVPLTRQHRTARLQWCREHHNWTEQDWACVLFSDESRFSLSSDSRRQLIWRESGTAYRPENIQEKDRYPTCSIMVWAGIMINGRTRLHVVANGTMTGQRYIDEVLIPHVRLFRGGVGDTFVFMVDNTTCHRTLAAQDCLDSEGIQRLVWPARSPDLNAIKNVRDALGRQVAGRNYPPTNKNTLIRALTEEWDKLHQQLLDNVVQSMGPSESLQEFAACINKLGTKIFQSSNSAQNTSARNANDQLLQPRFISGLRNDIRRFVLSRDPSNIEESINAALVEKQNVKLNQIANDERTGLSPLHTETSAILVLTNQLDEINLRVERLQEASSVTARKTGGGLFRRRETVFKCFYCGLDGHRQTECRIKRAEERQSNSQHLWGNAAGKFSVFRHPNTRSFDQRRVHFHDSAFRDNYTAYRHSATVPQRTSRGRGNAADFRQNTRNGNLIFRGLSRF
ncbi:transposable element Tcb1 transposase [Trichonephila clavipes]|uniref:Transposable element Tcb1 transposase n=1 Tax=Trichonephila clavipes TaxID=2585209 RepID=A0A8X6V6A6_TRICX|nr:transposable element Tcb1 transposase [Trichonephila clavipes]